MSRLDSANYGSEIYNRGGDRGNPERGKDNSANYQDHTMYNNRRVQENSANYRNQLPIGGGTVDSSDQRQGYPMYDRGDLGMSEKWRDESDPRYMGRSENAAGYSDEKYASPEQKQIRSIEERLGRELTEDEKEELGQLIRERLRVGDGDGSGVTQDTTVVPNREPTYSRPAPDIDSSSRQKFTGNVGNSNNSNDRYDSASEIRQLSSWDTNKPKVDADFYKTSS